MSDFSSILRLARANNISDDIKSIIRNLVQITYAMSSPKNFGIRLAALFDLCVSCRYYANVANKGWTYCNSGIPRMVYAYTNICPICLSKSQFVYTKANKPESGQIGMITTEILCQLYAEALRCKGHNVTIQMSSEPIDVIIYEDTTQTMIIGEVKAAPLLSIPICVECDSLTEEIDGVLNASQHSLCDNPFIKKSTINLYFPSTKTQKERQFILPINWEEENPFFKAIIKLVNTDHKFLPYYFSFWGEAYNVYSSKIKDNPVFWLTNACGSPTPRPQNWPQRHSGGFETISDAKTSVGMDRTDDIKKGIYQVLKLGAEFKPTYPNVKTALISNVHAVRHQTEYLASIKDIIWTIDKSRRVSEWSELPPGTSLYNLFDGIISLTFSDIRDPQLKQLFNFSEQ